MMIATVSFAQNHLVATLTHEGTIKNFYGASALQEAHEAATHGDIINLSSGTFTATHIKKAITLRGAGMDSDPITNREPTIITGEFNIDVNIIQRLTIEGIYSDYKMTYTNAYDPVFIKCRFKEITYGVAKGTNSQMYNAAFIHCKVSSTIRITKVSSVSCQNCVLTGPICETKNLGVDFTNCVIITGSPEGIHNSNMKNCFIHDTAQSGAGSIQSIPSTTTMFNNVVIHTFDTVYNRDVYKNATNSTNTNVSSLSIFFKTYKGKWDDNETFELTDEAKAKYLGTDGTQIGIYGGDFPFESTPSNPQITNCEVAKKSTADGKLSVKITVDTRD